MPNQPNVFNTFHASQLKRFHSNNPNLFPSREHEQPSPVMTADGLEEYAIEKIIDERKRRRGKQYLVRWVGYGPEEDCWLPAHELDECEALDRWLEREDGPCAR
jgi:hypothetical protein